MAGYNQTRVRQYVPNVKTNQQVTTNPTIQLGPWDQTGVQPRVNISPNLSAVTATGSFPNDKSQPDVTALRLTGSFPNDISQPDVSALKLTGTFASDISQPDVSAIQLTGSFPNDVSAITNINLNVAPGTIGGTDGIIASKDVYVDNTGPLCVGATQHNTQNLVVDGTAATSKWVYIGFDLSIFPAGSTVDTTVTPKLFLRKQANTNLTAMTISISTIAAGNTGNTDEGWNEATTTCAPGTNSPAKSTGGITSFSVTAGEGETDVIVSLPTTGAFITQANAALGSHSLTLILDSSSTADTVTFYDKDQATTSKKPRLSLAVNKAV